MKTEKLYFKWARVAIAVSCVFATVMVDAGLVSAGVKAPKVVSIIRKFMNRTKMPIRKIIDGAKAIDKNGKKIYRAIDLVDNSIGIGKGMLGKLADGVADDVIEKCVKIVKANKGVTGELSKILEEATMKSANLKGAVRDLVLSDAYLRIAQKTGRISMEEADEAFRLLKNTEGLHVSARRLCSASKPDFVGHLYELRQAITFQKKGFEVLGLDIIYADGVKGSPLDLDMLMRKGKRVFLIESKHSGAVKPAVIRTDADSLINLKVFLNAELGDSAKITPIFTFGGKPTPDIIKQLEDKGVDYLVGEAKELAEILSALQ